MLLVFDVAFMFIVIAETIYCNRKEANLERAGEVLTKMRSSCMCVFTKVIGRVTTGQALSSALYLMLSHKLMSQAC